MFLVIFYRLDTILGELFLKKEEVSIKMNQTVILSISNPILCL